MSATCSVSKVFCQPGTSSEYEDSLNEFGFRETNPDEIYRTPLSQALKRPVWEHPDIDITGIFDTKKESKWMENFKNRTPNPTLRTDFLDLLREDEALLKYESWVYAL